MAVSLRPLTLLLTLALAAAPACRRRDLFPGRAPSGAPERPPPPSSTEPPAPLPGRPEPLPPPPSQPGPPLVGGQGPLPGSPGSFAQLVRASRGSVVSVFTSSVELTGMQWGRPVGRQVRGLGTGFVITHAGEILTNHHVIQRAQNIEVQLDDGRRFGASVVGSDPRLDVALLRLKIPGGNLQPARLGNSDLLQVGDWVMAIGNPHGLSQTVTAGIVSALGRTSHEVALHEGSFGNLIQTDASINPGNSGGPMFNLSGEVVGINVAIRPDAQGLCFAIPINMARTIVEQLRQYGRVVRSWMGVTVESVTEGHARYLRLPDTHGALVAEVVPSGPADQAGIRPGDVLRRFDGQELRDSTQLPWLASSAGVGHRARVELYRGGQPTTVEVVLAAVPEPPAGFGMIPIPPPNQ
ncbi:MAG: trypsin-like peptidase domain-containing protein [Deltaproteobacteria bacterium]|nr:trypsin-like peptidase domain-containing protein [Deltaproteobacteria bacterium]